MSAFDGNRDGVLELPEQIDQLQFRMADKNHDGSLNRTEFAKIHNPTFFDRADQNRDGLVDAPEYEREQMIERGGSSGSG